MQPWRRGSCEAVTEPTTKKTATVPIPISVLSSDSTPVKSGTLVPVSVCEEIFYEYFTTILSRVLKTCCTGVNLKNQFKSKVFILFSIFSKSENMIMNMLRHFVFPTQIFIFYFGFHERKINKHTIIKFCILHTLIFTFSNIM